MPRDPLPPVADLSRAAILRFEVTRVLPGAIRLLHRHLGYARLARVLARLCIDGRRDPLRSVPRLHRDAEREALARRQFASVVRIDDALRAERSLSTEPRMTILRELLAQSGAAFIAGAFPLPAPASWRAASPSDRQGFLTRATRWFVNADIAEVRTDERSLGFDVERCLFAELARAIDRPYLGPLFCVADEVYFGRPDCPVALTRTRTLATDGQPCDFRFRYR